MNRPSTDAGICVLAARRSRKARGHAGSFGLLGAACVALLLASAGTARAGAEWDPRLPDSASQDKAVDMDSGMVPAPSKGAVPVVVYTRVVHSPGAPWMRLWFGDCELGGLSGAAGAGAGAFIRLTSMRDGAQQFLTAESLVQWANSSAYFNGETVVVDLMAWPSGPECRVSVQGVTVGVSVSGNGGYDSRSLCGGDNRTLSSENGNARMLPAGCTAWIFNDTNRTMLSAGHCLPAAGTVVQFNVPLSGSDGTLMHPLPEDQYAVEPTSVQSANAGLGNDWAYFGTYPNANTGLTPFQAQNVAYVLASAVPQAGNQQVRLTGYGSTGAPVSSTWNQVQKTDTGGLEAVDGSLLRYTVDTTGGNSGSPLVLESSRTVLAIHTNAGCTTSGGANMGTSVMNPSLRWALANPRGVCLSGFAAPIGDIFVIGDINNNFGTVASNSAEFGRIAQVGAGMEGLAADPGNQRFLGINAARTLVSIDPRNGLTSELGQVTGTSLVINGLAFDPVQAVLYGISQGTGQLFSINPWTRVATPIGNPGGGNISGIDFDAQNGIIYGIDDAPAVSRLVVINPQTGQQSIVGNLGLGITDCNGLAWSPDDGQLYTIDAPSRLLVRVEAATGLATVIGPTQAIWDGGFGMGAMGQLPANGICQTDFNGDGDVGTDADIEAFFECLAGNCCPSCGTADFNGDADIGTDADIESFFRVLAGGNC